MRRPGGVYYSITSGLGVFLILSLFNSCSWVSSSRRSLIGNDPGSTEDKRELVDAPATPPSNSVTRTEYEDLLRRYEDLSRKYAQTKENEVLMKTEKDKNSIDPRDDVSKNAQLVETVDIFDSQTKPIPEEVSSSIANKTHSSSETGNLDQPISENDIMKVRKAKNYIDSKNYEKAMEILQPLEQVENRQIKVRVKYMIGTLLMSQNEFDLAMQVFEEVIQKYAFSGYTLEALKELVVCTEKLSLTKKRDQYFSILNDVFGKS